MQSQARDWYAVNFLAHRREIGKENYFVLMKTRGGKTSRGIQAQLFLSNYSIFQSLHEFQLPSAGSHLFFLSPVTNVIALLLTG